MNLVLTVALEIPIETTALSQELLSEHVALELRDRLERISIAVTEQPDLEGITAGHRAAVLLECPVTHCRLLGIRRAAVPEGPDR